MEKRYPNFGFKILHEDPKSRARIGQIKTPHGTIETPNFIFCGTKATIKGLNIEQVKAAQTDIILANTYHLLIQPGPDLVEKAGGLHKFMNWDGPMLTDSGGYQIFSMGHGSVASEVKGNRQLPQQKSLTKITEEGAVFRNYLNGSKICLTPEKSIDIQRKLGADLIVQLDECTPFHVDKAYTERSMHLSHRWGQRSLAEFDRKNNGAQALYGIVQGGVYEDLRPVAAQYTRDHPFFGTAIGGSLGADKTQMYDVVAMTVPHIAKDRPVHLLGIGGIEDILTGVEFGMDTFDCVSPTRIARHGWAIAKGVPKNRLNIRNARFKEDLSPLNEDCPTCSQYSKAYIHHLLKAEELLALQLISINNVYMMNRLMREVREGIKTGTLDQVRKSWLY